MAKFDLIDKKDTIIQEIKDNTKFYKINTDLLTAYRGGLKELLVAEYEKMDSETAREYTKQLTAPVNVHQKLVAKLSTIYAGEPERTTKKASDRKLLEFYDEELAYNSFFGSANELFNGMKSSAIQIMVDPDTNEIQTEVLPNNSFYVYSDRLGSQKMDAFVKFVGTDKSINDPDVDVDIMFMYTDEQFLAVDSEGTIRVDHMEGLEDGINPYGVIPFSYVNRDEFSIMPLADQDTLAMTLAIPAMYTDLRYAIYFLSYSVLNLHNMEIPEGFSWTPNGILTTKDADGAEAPGRIEIIKGQVDIQATSQFILDLVRFWFETKGIKSTAGGTANAGNALSAASLMIQEADTAEDKKKQITFFKPLEKDFFKKLATIHNYLYDNNSLAEDTPKKRFDDKFKVETEFEPVEELVKEEVEEKVEE